MKNYVQPGNVLSIPAPAAVASGEPVFAGQIVGIASGHAAAGETVDVATVGVFEIPKVAANAFALGDPVYWDGSEGLATSADADTPQLGVAVEAAGASVATVTVRLSGF